MAPSLALKGPETPVLILVPPLAPGLSLGPPSALRCQLRGKETAWPPGSRCPLRVLGVGDICPASQCLGQRVGLPVQGCGLLVTLTVSRQGPEFSLNDRSERSGTPLKPALAPFLTFPPEPLDGGPVLTDRRGPARQSPACYHTVVSRGRGLLSSPYSLSPTCRGLERRVMFTQILTAKR